MERPYRREFPRPTKVPRKLSATLRPFLKDVIAWRKVVQSLVVENPSTTLAIENRHDLCPIG